jgi:hypothetical protein
MLEHYSVPFFQFFLPKALQSCVYAASSRFIQAGPSLHLDEP